MSLNGLSEAFVHATATRAQLGALNRAILGFSLLYVALALQGSSAVRPAVATSEESVPTNILGTFTFTLES